MTGIRNRWVHVSPVRIFRIVHLPQQLRVTHESLRMRPRGDHNPDFER